MFNARILHLLTLLIFNPFFLLPTGLLISRFEKIDQFEVFLYSLIIIGSIIPLLSLRSSRIKQIYYEIWTGWFPFFLSIFISVFLASTSLILKFNENSKLPLFLTFTALYSLSTMFFLSGTIWKFWQIGKGSSFNGTQSRDPKSEIFCTNVLKIAEKKEKK